MVGAERDKKYVEKLKSSNKYDEYKKKKAEAMKKLRTKKKQQEQSMTAEELAHTLTKRREATRKRTKKYREQAKTRMDMQKVDEENSKQSIRLSKVVNASYSNVQTLAKAVKKVSLALPTSPRKKNAILATIVSHLDKPDQQTLVNVVENPKFKKSSITKPDDIHKFYVRDDISRVSPRAKDVKAYKCPETGEELLFPARHMTMSIKEAYALFIEQQQKENLGMSYYYLYIFLF